MGSILRGIRNTFRNGIRAGSIVAILGLSVGLAVVMLLALMAVDQKINDVKSSIGNTISISPAGFNPGNDANNGLTTESVNKITSLPHITNVTENLTSRLTTEGTTSSFGRFGDQNSTTNNTTSLTSPIDLSQLNRPGGNTRFLNNGGSSLPSNFSLPIQVLGTTDPGKLNGSTVTIKQGKTIDGSKDANEVLVSTDMANKNNLKVGSTFTAYGATMTVDGIFDSGTQAGNGTILLSLPAVQRLSGSTDLVSSAVATVDSLDNLSGTTTAVKNSLGSDSADIQSSQDQADATIKPLQNIETVSLYSLVGAVAAGAIVILMTMLMIVRERRREIGVLKAIGASNLSVITQFVAEAVTFTGLGTVVGVVIGLLLSNRILQALVDSASTSTSTATTTAVRGFGGGFRGGGFGGGAFRGGFGQASQLLGARNSLAGLHTHAGWELLVYGLVIALAIAILGSAVPAYLSARVKPAEVLRSE